MKEMNQAAKDALNDVTQKMLKESQVKRKQAEELLASAKILEDTVQRLSKELDAITVSDKSSNIDNQ